MKTTYKLALAGLVLGLAGCDDAGSDEPTLGSDTATVGGGDAKTGSSAKSFDMGDPVNFDAFEITIKSVKHPSTIGVLDQRPAEGGLFVAIDYTLENTGDEPLSGFDHPTLLLMDSEGRTYAPDSQATSQYVLEKVMITKDFSKQAGDDLNPGLKILAGAVWEIAKDQFDRNTWKVVLKGHENAAISLAEPSAKKNGSVDSKSKEPETACVPELAGEIGLSCP